MSAGPEIAALPEAGRGTAGPADTAGLLLGRLSVLPALLAMAWLLAGLPLLLAGRFRLPLMLAVSVPLAAAVVIFGLRWLPGRWPGTAPVPGTGRTPWWAVAGVLAVAAGFGAAAMIYHSQQIIILRDPASYVQFAAWIARHGSLPIPQSRAAFGGIHHVLIFNSPAFYQVGREIVPQFMAALPMVLAAGFWAGGVSAAVMVAPVLGAAAVLTFGGLTARLAGPRWAPVAALALALSLPEQYTSRSTFSEPLAQILFLGGLCLVADALGADGTAARVLAGLGGLALGITVLARIDGVSDILLVIPYSGLLLIRRQPQALPLIGGLLIGGLYGIADGLLLSRPYLHHIQSVLKPLVTVAVLLLIAVGMAVLVLRDRGVPRLRWRWLPAGAGAAPFAALIVFAVRPYLAMRPGPGQTKIAWQHYYFQFSLDWVFWYIGVPAVLLAALGAGVLARRCLRGQAPVWALPLLTIGWTVVTVLYRPSIVPHQPWASRRLVPAVLPGLILLAVWASGWLTGRVRRSGCDSLTVNSAATLCAAVLLVPATMTTFGLGLRDNGRGGITPVAGGWAFHRTESGEIAAVSRMCAALPRDASVVIIDGRASGRLTEVVRGMCGVPAAVYDRPQPAVVGQIVRGIEAAGRRPVLLATSSSELTPYGTARRQIMLLHTRQDRGSSNAFPRGTAPLDIGLWMTEPAR